MLEAQFGDNILEVFTTFFEVLANDVKSFSGSSFPLSKAVDRRCSKKGMLFKISQNSQENTSAGVSFSIKLQAFKNIYFAEHLRTAASALCHAYKKRS